MDRGAQGVVAALPRPKARVRALDGEVVSEFLTGEWGVEGVLGAVPGGRKREVVGGPGQGSRATFGSRWHRLRQAIRFEEASVVGYSAIYS